MSFARNDLPQQVSMVSTPQASGARRLPQAQTQPLDPIKKSYVGGEGHVAAAQAELQRLEVISQRTNKWADEEAIQAGKNAGIEAGLKPDFSPLRGTGLYSKAFDQAGIQTYANTVESTALQNMQRIYNENRGDPTKLRQALDDWGGNYEAELFDEIKPTFRKLYSDRSLAFTAAADRDYEQNLIDNTIASNETALQAQANTVYAMARNVGNDQIFAKNIEQERGLFVARLLQHAPREGGEFEGIQVASDPARLAAYSWRDIQTMVQKFDMSVAEQRALGQLSRAQDKEGFRQQWLETYSKAGSAVYTPDLIDHIDSRMRGEISRAEGEAGEQRAKRAFDLDLALKTAEVSNDPSVLPTFDDIQIMVDKQQLTPSQGLKLSEDLAKTTKSITDYHDAVSHVELAAQAGVAVDASNKIQMKVVNDRYVSEISKQTGDAATMNARKASYAARMGVLPNALDAEIRSGLRSTNPEAVANATDLYNRLKSANPRLAQDLPEQDRIMATTISMNVEKGYNSQDALVKARENMNVPPAQKEARGKEFDGLIKSSKSSSWIQSQVNSIWHNDPNSIDPAMVMEFDDASRTLYMQSGDLDAARTEALQQVQKTWAKSRVGSSNRWTKHSPEKIYGVPTLDDAANAKWMNEQLVDDLTQGSITVGDWSQDSLMVTPDVSVTSPSGKPVYNIMHKDENGVWQRQLQPDGQPMQWYPQWEQSKMYKKLLDEQKKNVDQARAKRNALMGQ